MTPRPLLLFALCLATALPTRAQVLDATPQPAPAPASEPTATTPPPPGEKGSPVPVLDPGSELLTWNGRNWNINNQRLFQARFEKYLNAPEGTTAEDQEYQSLLRAITDKLAPGKATPANVDDAFRMLPRAAAYEIDAHLSESIADAVYTSWQAMRNAQRIEKANASLEQERKSHEWNTRIATDANRNERAPSRTNEEATKDWAKRQQLRRDAEMLPYTTRLAEALAAIKLNQAKKELSELQAKIEFQTLLVQLFVQRRFQHVIIASRFYRAVFTDGDSSLHVGSDTKDLFAKTTGNPPTVNTLDALAHEAMRDAREGVKAFQYLADANEMESASKRLAEAFLIGEYLPDLRTLPRERKRATLLFTQQANQLINALDVKDYARAETLVRELEKTARDFDASRPLAAIETARTVSAMHLAKARNAAVSGDRTTLETELKAATEIWPRNPALQEISGRIFDSADIQQQALADLERLLTQQNYRQIFDDKLRFIAATALYPDRQEKLRQVLNDMAQIETAILRSTEIAKHGDAAGAWETAEATFLRFPQDNKLNQLRANLTTEAADFVRTLRTAQSLEEKGETGSSLAWYLKAQKLYPATTYGREGIERLVGQIIPEETGLEQPTPPR